MSNGDGRGVISTDKLLLYAMTVIVAMLSWFMVMMYNKIEIVSNEQNRRTSMVETFGKVNESVREIEKNQWKIATIEYWVNNLKERVEYLEKFSFGAAGKRGDGK